MLKVKKIAMYVLFFVVMTSSNVFAQSKPDRYLDLRFEDSNVIYCKLIYENFIRKRIDRACFGLGGREYLERYCGEVEDVLEFLSETCPQREDLIVSLLYTLDTCEELSTYSNEELLTLFPPTGIELWPIPPVPIMQSNHDKQRETVRQIR